jgi:hypothetical protein
MFLLVFGMAAAFGSIAMIAFSLLVLVNDGVQKPDEAYRETRDGEAILNEDRGLTQNFLTP